MVPPILAFFNTILINIASNKRSTSYMWRRRGVLSPHPENCPYDYLQISILNRGHHPGSKWLLVVQIMRNYS